MNRIYVPLSDADREHLIDLAIAERRRPQEQAALLLSRALAEAAAPPPADVQPGVKRDAVTA